MREITRKEQILDASAKVFSEMGFHGAKVEDIALEANVGKGTVYEYFTSKRQLFEEVMLNVLETYITQAMEAMEGAKDPGEKLKRFIRFQYMFSKTNQHVARLLLRRHGEMHDIMMEKLLDFRKRILAFVGNIIEEGMRHGTFREVDPYYASILFMGVLQEAGTLLYTGQEISEEALDKMLDYYLYGIGK
jgi:TetR/AcrR family fatty acid metabolism transcriptional regulator